MSLAKDIDPHELYKPSKRYFWAAYDALDVKATDILSQGISQMLTMTRCVVNQGMAMIKKGEVDTRSYFHHATIDASADIQFFQQPMALIRVGHHIIVLFISYSFIYLFAWCGPSPNIIYSRFSHLTLLLLSLSLPFTINITTYSWRSSSKTSLLCRRPLVLSSLLYYKNQQLNT